jgi:hypothetical protein
MSLAISGALRDKHVAFPVKTPATAILGFDLASQPQYLEALQRSCAAGTAVASTPVALGQESSVCVRCYAATLCALATPVQ